MCVVQYPEIIQSFICCRISIQNLVMNSYQPTRKRFFKSTRLSSLVIQSNLFSVISFLKAACVIVSVERKLRLLSFSAKWKKGFDGSLRPHMGLKFVPPNLYNRTKGDERHFREKIYNYEHSDTLTLRSSALSRMMRQTAMPTTRETMEPLPENDFPPIANGTAPHHHQNANFATANDHHRACLRDDDLDIF